MDWNKDVYIYSGSGGIGVMNMNHDIVIRDKYSSIEFLEDGNFLSYNGKYEILDKGGNVVSSFDCETATGDYEEYSPYIKGFDAFAQRDKNYVYSLIDKKGNEVGKKSYSRLFSGDYYANFTYNVSDNFIDWNKEAKESLDSLLYLAENGLGKTLDEFDYFDVKSGKPKNYNKKDVRKEIKRERMFRVKLFEEFDSKLASYNYSYYSSSYYSWNSNAKGFIAAIDIYAEKESFYNSCLNLMKTTMTPADETIKKIKIFSSLNNAVFFKKNDIVYFITNDKNDKKKEFLVGAILESSLPSVEEDAEETPKPAKKKSTSSDEW